MAQTLKNPPAMQETWVQSLGQEDPLEKGMATHSSVLAWRIPWIEEPGRLQSMGHKELDMTEQVTLSAFFIVQLSHPYMTTRKIKALTIQTMVGKVMSASVRSLLVLRVCVCACLSMYIYILLL